MSAQKLFVPYYVKDHVSDPQTFHNALKPCANAPKINLFHRNTCIGREYRRPCPNCEW